MIPDALVAIAAPSECALLDWIRPRVQSSWLEQIAANDYRQEIADHLAGIVAQLGPRPPLGLPPWCPREVLELERWREPDEASVDTPPSGEGGHLRRLLACVILLRNGAYIPIADAYEFEEDFFLRTSAASLRQLTLSAFALGVRERALGFLLWLVDAQQHNGLQPFAAFCALALAAGVGFGDATEQEILELCNWVDAEEQRRRAEQGDEVYSARWLIGLNSYERDDSADWRMIARQAFEQERREFAPAIREAIERFSARLADSAD